MKRIEEIEELKEQFISQLKPLKIYLSSYSKKIPTSKVGDELRLLPT